MFIVYHSSCWVCVIHLPILMIIPGASEVTLNEHILNKISTKLCIHFNALHISCVHQCIQGCRDLKSVPNAFTWPLLAKTCDIKASSSAPSQYKDCLLGYGISIIKIRLSWDRLIFMVGIPILVRRHLYAETGPWFHKIFAISSKPCM